uniref:RNA helicase n=1 Tax=Cynoglossus semilaevis TaxID=244447 RepID=W8QCV8_CYNSE|nr:vas-l [Cynoglossus semilaevis]
MDDWEETENAEVVSVISCASTEGSREHFWKDDSSGKSSGGWRGRWGRFTDSLFSRADEKSNGTGTITGTSSFNQDWEFFKNTEGQQGGIRGRGRGRGFGRENRSDFNGDSNGFCESEFRGVSRGGHGGRGGRGRGFRRGTEGGSRGGFREDGEQRGRGGFRGGYRGKGENNFFQEKENKELKQRDEGSADKPKVSYIPPALAEDENSVFAHYETGINFDKYDDILVNVSGTNPPQAIMTFEEAALCDSLSKNVSRSGYVKPTPVQKHGIPIISAGRDLMACAQTGSGKTAAFLLPILHQLMIGGASSSFFSELQEPKAIIVAPTRELINQIFLEARKFAYGTVVRPVVVYGGVSIRHQVSDLNKGCNVLCGTPGRLMDMIERGKGGLSKVQYFVLDEADRMLDMGFEPDMRRLVASPGMPSREGRQTLMFSATFPEEIQKLAADFLKPDYLFLAVGIVGGACSDVEQTFIEVGKFSKREQLLDLVKTCGNERTIVFVEKKRQADFIATFLCQENVPTTSIHGDREQWQREQALADFKYGKCPVLVATSVAARGLDIPDVQHVVNFDLPGSIDEYVHRIGRTGRCGNVGRAVSFFDTDVDGHLSRPLISILSKAQQEVPPWLEQLAFSSASSGGNFNANKNNFAFTDSRKGQQRGSSFQGNTVQSQVTAVLQPPPEEEEEWE